MVTRRRRSGWRGVGGGASVSWSGGWWMFDEVAGYALFEGDGRRVMVVVGHWTCWTCCFAFEGGGTLSASFNGDGG